MTWKITDSKIVKYRPASDKEKKRDGVDCNEEYFLPMRPTACVWFRHKNGKGAFKITVQNRNGDLVASLHEPLAVKPLEAKHDGSDKVTVPLSLYGDIALVRSKGPSLRLNRFFSSFLPQRFNDSELLAKLMSEVLSMVVDI